MTSTNETPASLEFDSNNKNVLPSIPSTSTAQQPLPAITNNTFDIYGNISYEDALDDMHTRFILNLPESELLTADRIFVQLEQAWWFYEDFICDPRPHLSYLPRYSHLRPFAKEIFDYSTVLPDASQFNEMWKQYSVYKKKISNYGCILLSADYQRIVLCQVYNGKSFTLPSGKINEGEDGAAAAARETYEETGFDPSCTYGITATWKEQAPTQITWNVDFQHPKNKLVHQEDHNGKRRTCYVIVGVPENFPFLPVCRKEVSNIVWFNINDVSSIATFAVVPFMKPLRGWINKQLKHGENNNATVGSVPTPQQQQQQLNRDHSNPKSRNTTSTNKKGREKNKVMTPQRNSRANSRHRDVQIIDNSIDNIVSSGLGTAGENARWSEEEMFSVNAQLLGRNITTEYDGNPHLFTDVGLSKIDPHSYRIVGGTLLNQNTTTSVNSAEALHSAPNPSRLQPLFNANESSITGNNDDGLTPFFSQDGSTPWGEIIPGVTSVPSTKKPKQHRNKTMSPVKESRMKNNNTITSSSNKNASQMGVLHDIIPITTNYAADTDNIVPTDAQITAKSQATKKLTILKKPPPQQLEQKPEASNSVSSTYRTSRKEQYERDMAFVQDWVANLPKPQPTKHFGLFTLDADAIMAQAAYDVKKQQIFNT